MFLGKRTINLIYLCILSASIILTLQSLWSRFGFLVQEGSARASNPWSSSLKPSPLELPDDYRHNEEQSPLCEHRLGLSYLEDLRHSRATYCSEQSQSHLTCFHSQLRQGGRIDSFCIGQGATLDRSRTPFQISCDLLDTPWRIETNESSVPLASFPEYMYATGPHKIITEFVNLAFQHLEHPIHEEPENFTVLLKREGVGNPWHSLMEIMSLAITFDVLQTSPDSRRENGGPFMTSNDVNNTQVIILDDKVDGPFFGLWQLFAKKPTIRLSELPPGEEIGNIIIPLPGGSNPFWQGDWEPNSCTDSELMRAFAKRVLRHLNIPDSRKPSWNENGNGIGKEDNKIIVTFISRQGTRKLLDEDKHMAALHNRYEHAEIQLVDLESMPLAEQIQIVRDSDVLAGVHGAGLTHGIWMREGSVVVEILPLGLAHKGFRNLAGAMGLGYFSTHALLQPNREPASAQNDGNVDGPSQWQIDDVALEEDRFLELMDVAVKSMYNKGPYNFDAYK